MNSKKYSVVALGELLIDMTNNGITERNNTLFEANPGGAPGNVLAMLRRFNHKVAMIGKVGNDMFGSLLIETLKDLGIESDYVVRDKDSNTTLAFVKTFDDGDRDFSFYRNPGADMMLKVSDIDDSLLEDTEVFHFGTLSMTHEDVRKATIHAIKKAKEAGALISFDPNLRPPLWSNLDLAKEQVLEGLKYCDYLKISDNEISWLTGSDDFDEGVKIIREKYDIPLITVTAGRDGSIAYYRDYSGNGKEIRVEVPAYIVPDTVETTGAGDTFCGCMIHYLLEKGIKGLTEKDLEEMLKTANAGAAVITTRNGALRVMPSINEIEDLRKKYER